MSDVSTSKRFRRAALLVTVDWFALSHFRPVVEVLREVAEEVVVITDDSGRCGELEALGVRVVSFDFHRETMNPFVQASATRRLAQILKRQRPELVHMIAMKPIVIGGLAARLANVPRRVVHVTGAGHLVISPSRRAKLVRLAVLAHIKQMTNRARGVLLVENEDDLALLQAAGVRPGARVQVLGGAGVDEEHYCALPPPLGPPTAAYVGRLIESKGVDTLLEAHEMLWRRGVRIETQVHGRVDRDSPAATFVERAQEGVEWCGFADDVREVWKDAHVFVLPAKAREGMPRAMLEAAACARPLIVTNVPGCRHFVRDGIEGRVAPPDDSRALADAIEEVLGDEKLAKRMGQAARARVLTGFTEDHIRTQLRDAYARV